MHPLIGPKTAHKNQPKADKKRQVETNIFHLYLFNFLLHLYPLHLDDLSI